MKVSTNLSKNLHRIVRERGITQSYIAKQLDVAATTVNAWFRGANYPRYDMLEKLAKLLNTSVEELTADESNYNSTIQNDSNFVKTPIASSASGVDKPSVLPKMNNEENNGTLLNKTKEFWQIMQAVDGMSQKKQKQVLDMINIMNQK
ncbi:helix-turn-helix domain-containing protein [Lactobacillus kitasatonis]|uniref:helix-turn-helix domain-containing protein n=1 Tax=Lactobacillus kitasatonis TaxID=237446 RepID=UPI003F674F26